MGSNKKKSDEWLQKLKQIADNIKSKDKIYYTEEMLLEFSKIEKAKERFKVTPDILNQTFNYKAD